MLSSRKRSWHRARVLLGSLITTAAIVAGLVAAPTATAPAQAADLSQFDPGNIISDAVFFNANAMSQQQIQTFLQGKEASCAASATCAKDYYTTTKSVAADAMCKAYSGGGSERASAIIYKVAQACGINPQVLIVTMQKEQGLITSVWPSTYAYNYAMGADCPDTTGCNGITAGFFGQVYKGAWQLKRYANPPGTSNYFTWYAPGHTWNILYNPNTSCGKKAVYIKNQATADLYYYTPYTPNAAALKAGYGTGDSCSSYGNRNFYSYFTDWFGSTQTAANVSPLVIAQGGADVYLITNSIRYHVLTPLDLRALASRLGGVQTVAQSYLDAIPAGGNVTRYIHDPRTGTLYLLEPDGSKHRFVSAAQIASFGYDFGSYVDLAGAFVDRFATGAEVGALFQPDGSPDVYLLDGTQRRHVEDGLALQAAMKVTTPYIATMNAAAAQAIAVGATYFAPNTLVRGASSGDVYLTTPTATIVHIPSFTLAGEFGATRYVVVPDADLKASVPAAGPLAPVATCDKTSYLAAGGKLYPLGSADTGGLATVSLTAADCAAFSVSQSGVTAPLFIQPTGGPEVYVVQDGSLHHVESYAGLSALNGSRPLTILSWAAATITAVGLGAPVLAEGRFVQFTGQPEVYQYSGGQLHHILSTATLLRLGGGVVPPIEQLPAAFKSAYTIGADVP